MTWSCSVIGTPEKIVEALETKINTGLTGQSKVEWDDAKPHLIALVQQNFVKDIYLKQNPNASVPLLKLDANGSGIAFHGKEPDQIERSCSVKIERIHGALV